MADASDRIKEHREQQERLEYFAEQARAVLAQRRKVLDGGWRSNSRPRRAA